MIYYLLLPYYVLLSYIAAYVTHETNSTFYSAVTLSYIDSIMIDRFGLEAIEPIWNYPYPITD